MSVKHKRWDVRRGDGMIVEKTTKAGELRYMARWWDDDQRRSKTFETAEDAEDHLRRIGRQKRAGTYTPESRLTVAELLTDYLERGLQRWSANTYASYRQIVTYRLIPALGAISVVQLRPSHIQAWVDQSLKDGYSASNIRNGRIILNGALKRAIALDVIQRNPVTGVDFPTRRSQKFDVWTPAEVTAVLDHVRVDPWLHAYYLLALTTGMRPGELRALAWADVDEDRSMVVCHRTITRDRNFQQLMGETTKTKSVRGIAVPPETIQALQRLRQDQRLRRMRAATWHDDDVVLDRGDGKFIVSSVVAKRHARVCQTAQVTSIRLHDLRHTCATLMLQSNIHPKIVSDILGHQSVSTTLDIYSHVSTDIQREAIAILSDVISGRKRA